MSPGAAATVAVLVLLVLLLASVGLLLVRIMRAPDPRLSSLETSLSLVQIELSGMKSALGRVETVVNRIVENALDKGH